MRPHTSASPEVSGNSSDRVMKPLSLVTARRGLHDLTSRLDELQTWLADDLSDLEVGIQELQGSGSTDANLAQKAAQYLLARPGKRIRPLCVLLGARLGGRGLDPKIRSLAVASELVHAATLLHDDVIDEGNERRGAPAARTSFGNSASILAGDHLLVKALQLVEGAGPHRLLVDLLQVISEMVAAEALQLERRGRFEPCRDDYLQIIRGKTASLFRWSLSAGGLAARISAEHYEALGEAGEALGVAFQLIDDVLDLDQTPGQLGKDTLVDLREGKLTWPTIIASERVPYFGELMRSRLQKLDSGPDQTTAELAQSIRRCGALEATYAFASAEADRAIRALGRLPESKARRAIETVVRSAIDRVG